MSEAMKRMQDIQRELGTLNISVEQAEQMKDLIAAYIAAKEEPV